MPRIGEQKRELPETVDGAITEVVEVPREWARLQPVKVDAYRFGSVAVHTMQGWADIQTMPATLVQKRTATGLPSDKYPEEWWRVTHLPSGYSFVVVCSKEDALFIAKLLWERCRVACLKPAKADLRKAIPSWVPDWCKACSEAGKLIPLPKGD